MAISQQTRLEITGSISRATYMSAAFLLGFGVAGGPVGAIALVTLLGGGVVLASAADYRIANPDIPFVNQYNPNQHYRVTTMFYSFFNKFSRVAGLHQASSYSNTTASRA